MSNLWMFKEKMMNNSLRTLILIPLFAICIFLILHYHTNNDINRPKQFDNNNTEDIHIAKEDFNPNKINVNNLPQKEFDYNSAVSSFNVDTDYVRLDKIVSKDLKIYSVGGDEYYEKILLVYKSSYFFPNWNTYSDWPLNQCMIYDYDGDGDDELALITHDGMHIDNLYIVELSDDKLWQYKKLLLNDKSLKEYIWNNLSYSYDKANNAIEFNSSYGDNIIHFPKDNYSLNQEWFSLNVQPETTNTSEIFLGGYIYSKDEGPLYHIETYSNAHEPNFRNYKLNKGDIILRVGIDKVQGSNYGEVFIKLKYNESEISFSKLDFLNNVDICY